MSIGVDWRVSVDFLEVLDSDVREKLVAGASRVTRPAGTEFEYPRTGRPTILESGLVRGFQRSEDGRQATVGYLYPGEYIGELAALAPLPTLNLQHLTDSTILELEREVVDRLFAGDARFARALLLHTTALLARMVYVVTIRTLGTVKERLVFDLLERASAEQLRSGELRFKLTHHQLAEGIGSAREVVTNELGELRASGIVSTRRGEVRVDDPVRLAQVVRRYVT